MSPVLLLLSSLQATVPFLSRYGIALDLKQPSFNAGVLLMNLAAWRKQQLTEEVS